MDLGTRFSARSRASFILKTAPRRPGAVPINCWLPISCFPSRQPNDPVRFGGIQKQRGWGSPWNLDSPRRVPLNAAGATSRNPSRPLSRPHVIATTNDLWILFPGRPSPQYDRHTGNRKPGTAVEPAVLRHGAKRQWHTVISSDESRGAKPSPHSRFFQRHGSNRGRSSPGRREHRQARRTAPTPPLSEVATNSADYAMLAKLVAAKAIKLASGPKLGRSGLCGTDRCRAMPVFIERKTIIHQGNEGPEKIRVDDNLTSVKAWKLPNR